MSALNAQHLTFGDFLKIPAMGVVSVLDLACTAEAAMDAQRRGDPTTELRDADGGKAPLDRLVEVIDLPWSKEVSPQDPRFTDLLPPIEGTIFECIERSTGEPEADLLELSELANALPLVEHRLHLIAGQPLEQQLLDLLRALSGFSGKKLQALSARLGWNGPPPITLDEAGEIAGITRERVRQLQKRVVERLPGHNLYLPGLDSALREIRQICPTSVDRAAALLIKKGISRVRFHPEAIVATASLLGRTPTYEIEQVRGQTKLVTTPYREFASAVISIACRQAGASGVSNLSEVCAEARATALNVNEAQVKEVLSLYSGVAFLEDGWFWDPTGKTGRNRLQNVTRKMLSVASPISVTSLREGVGREYRFRGARGLGTWPLVVPSRSVLRAFYAAHPEFNLAEGDLVSPVRPIDYRNALSDTEQIFVDVLRSSPACVLDRSSCAIGCLERGMNQNTFSLYLSYSPVVAHLGTDIWSLRGVRVDPAAVEAVREANAMRPLQRRVLDHGWTENGVLWVAVRLPALFGNFVFGIPGPIRRFVSGREFPTEDEKGAESGTVRVSQDGTSYGYSSFLRQKGADEGDIMVVEFDLASGKATLRLGDDELLEQLNGGGAAQAATPS